MEVPGTLSLSASGYFYMDITADSGSKADLDAAMSDRGWVYVSQDPTNTPASEAGTQGDDKISVYDEGSLVAKQPALNLIGSGVTAVNNAGANRIDITVSAGAPLTSTAPVNVDAGAAAVGTGTEATRNDHKHSITTGTPVDVGTSNSAGSGAAVALANHVHNTPFSAVNAALGAATASVSVNSQKITNLATPTADTDACTKAYADALQQGLDLKNSCHLATAAALSAYTASGSGPSKILTASANGALTVDGVAAALNDRVLVKDQAASHADHGIYYVQQVGSGSLPWILHRSTDADSSAKVTTGMYTFIEAGTANASSGWVLTTAMPITLETTALAFTQFSGAGQITAGTGLTKTGNTLNVGANADGSIVANADNVQVGVLATDAQHGTRGGGTQHSAATTSVNGFMSSTDKTKLDNTSAVLYWGNNNISTTTTARYLNPGFNTAAAATTTIQIRVPRSGTIRHLYIYHGSVGVGGNVVYTVRKNGTNQTLTCTLAASGSTAQDTTNSFTVVAGDRIDITVTKAAAITTSPTNVTATVEFVP
jgi:hypothetical protein